MMTRGYETQKHRNFRLKLPFAPFAEAPICNCRREAFSFKKNMPGTTPLQKKPLDSNIELAYVNPYD